MITFTDTMCDGPLNLTALKERIVKEAAAGIARARAMDEPTEIGRRDTYHFGASEAAKLCDVWHAFRDAEPEAQTYPAPHITELRAIER